MYLKIRIFGVFLILIFLGLLSRVFYLQIIKYKKCASEIENLVECFRILYPERGTIYDRNGKILATNVKGKRIYPLSVCRELIGFVSVDGSGLGGIEYEFDKILRGKKGIMELGRTPTGRIYPHPQYSIKPAIDGKDIILTIDADIQQIIEEALEDAVKAQRAKSGSVIVLNPKTGEILGIATYPHNVERLRPVTDLFEPGSTFKIATMLAVLKDNKIKPQDIVDDKGEIKVGDIEIKDLEKHGPITFAEAVWISSNVGFVKMARLVGKRRLYEEARLLGFGAKTGIKLPAEGKGWLPPYTRWTDADFACIAFGQGISCTLLQLAMAYQAIANKGILLKPRIVLEIRKGNKVYYSSKVEKVRRVCSEEVAKELTQLLIGVVEYGTGKLTKMKGIKIAGKTGTAQKFIKGKYSEDKNISTFVGFLPADDPQILVACMLDEPRYGLSSEVCVPLFRKIVKRIIKLKDYEIKSIAQK